MTDKFYSFLKVLLGMTCKPPFQKKALKNEEWMITVTPYLLYISAVFVITTFIIYAMIPKLQSIHGRCIMSYLVCLIVLYIGLGTIQLNSWVFHKYSGFRNICFIFIQYSYVSYFIIYRNVGSFCSSFCIHLVERDDF